jgi:electron transport complex protein RnfB
METGIDVYRKLQQHLDTFPVGYPATASGVEIRILKKFFTPEEAEVACLMTLAPEPVAGIYERVDKQKMSLEELGRMLEQMARKGGIIFTMRGGEKVYQNSMFVVGLYEFQVDRLTPDFLRDMGQYIQEAFGRELFRAKVPQLRTIPVEKSIPLPEKYLVDSYDDVKKLVENAAGPLAVANCICRQARDMAGQSCSVTDLRETCLILDGDQYIESGIGRPIGKAEAIEILEKAQKAGLVLQPLNTQSPWAICCCCGDCCGILRSIKQFPRPADYYASSFQAQIDADLCSGCGICVERCQLGAAYMMDGVAAINLDRCIGCGNCVVNCEYDAVRLIKKENAVAPPADMDELYRRILADKAGK